MDVHQTAAEKQSAREDFLFDEPLAELDPDISALIEMEEARQIEKIQLIASESICPRPVVAALASMFMNKYAEGYPSTRMVRKERARLPEFARHLAFFRRYSDRRYYKGTEYCDFVEALAQKRCAELFQHPRAPLDSIFVNAQPLSGAPANNAVYDALIRPYDTVMGMHLSHGGHLTHGSPVNRSGRNYKIVAYTVDPETWRLDYDAIKRQALECRPKLMIAGASAYPWEIDWTRFRAIADEAGAYLLADISHPAGLVSAGLFPNPVGVAHVTMFTTHKSMCGPRGAVLISTDPEIARKIDFAVFPGEQGGPHVNSMAAKAVSFGIAQTERFKRLQRRILDNARALAESFRRRNLPLAYGGTASHLLLLDLRNMKVRGGPLSADVAANILDLCGITCNKNTLPGDVNALRPSGLRFGTVVASQRGMGAAEMDRIAEMVQRVLSRIEPFRLRGTSGRLGRGKIEYSVMAEVRAQSRALTGEFPPFRPPAPEPAAIASTGCSPGETRLYSSDRAAVLEIRGERACGFLNQSCTADMSPLKAGAAVRAAFLDPSGATVDRAVILCQGRDERGRSGYIVAADGDSAIDWLAALSDGFVGAGPDKFGKIAGPVAIRDLRSGRRGLVPIGIAGPRAPEVLRRATSEALEPGNFRTVRIAGANVVAALVEGLAILLAESSEATRVYKALAVAGDEYSIGEGSGPLPAPRVDPLKVFYIGQPSAEGPSHPAFAWEPPPDTGKKTPLFGFHKSKNARILPFAGYQMPGWYGPVAEEHEAVRRAAGIFDVGHMGVFEVSGEAAAEFLDTVTTNFVLRVEPGHSQYSYVLDVDGRVMDDIIVYRLDWDRFMLVVNAANQDKLWAWFNAVNERRAMIDRDHPERVAPGPVLLRNLKAMSSGDDMRMDIAFQGRAALPVLLELVDNDREREAVRKLKRFQLTPARVGGLDLIVSRTGYTGEETGFELFVHPRHALALTEALLQHGGGTGVRMAGLAARDSARTEAGFPLYGHELAGPHDVTPLEAGYGSFVKRHKVFFVGRRPMIEREDAQEYTIVRFQMVDTGIRAIRSDDRVISRSGSVIGFVTSCCVVGKSQIGMAYIDREYSEEKTELGIVTLPRKEGETDRPRSELKIGDKVSPHYRAVVLPRFQFFGSR
jgi:glycine hydroxymethyltransferase